MTAVYSGTFDPITLGHIDLIQRAAGIFDKVVIAVAAVSGKCTLLSVDERVQLAKEATAHLSNVEVEKFLGLLVEFCKSKGASVILRGLRAVTDFEHELQMAIMNRQITNNAIETVFMMPAQDYFYISSSIVKEIMRFGGDTSKLLPEVVNTYLRKKLKVDRI